MKKTPDLYIIHGWTYTTAPWERTLNLLEKRGLKVEMLHVPGLTSASRKVWTIEDYVRWADRQLPAGAVALGHSNGGRILLNLCAEKPDRLKHLILLDAAGVYEASSKRDFAREVSKKLGFLKKIPGFTRIWHKLTGATDYAKAPENMKKTLSNMIDSDKKLDLTKVTVPTTILWGEADTITPPRQAEVMHEKITNSMLEIFPEWTHAPYISHPEQLAKAIYQAYKKPPVVQARSEHIDAAASSAALALKKAPEPVLKSDAAQNPVAPNVPTKLVLHKDSKLTKGMVVSDSEGAAVKYEAKISEVPTKRTNASMVSAALALKKSSAKSQPESGSKMPVAEKTKTETNAIAELSELNPEATKFVALEPGDATTLLPGAITSASVPKVSRLERAKRKVSRKKGQAA